jgi:hypothetical protein
MVKNILFFLFALGYSFCSYTQVEKRNTEDAIIINEDTNEVNFVSIEKVPVYKGCDKNLSNAELRSCMSQKITQHVLSNFNTDIANNLNLPDGKIRISVIFNIDKKGNIINARSRAFKPELEKEAIRVINLIPQMDSPGIQEGIPVIVPYALPIVFNVEKKKSITNSTKYPVYKGCNENASPEFIKKCTERKIINFIKMSVDMELASALFPQSNSTQFKVDFIITKKGKVKDVTAKAHHKKMAIEAINVVKRLPKLKSPGFIDGKPVDTPFSLLLTLYFD